MRIQDVTLLVCALACTLPFALACPRVPPLASTPEPPADACAAVGPGLAIDGIEGSASSESYDDELAALEIASLPSSISLAPLSDFERTLVLYMLDPPDAADVSERGIDRDSALTTGLGRAVLGAFARASDDGSAGVDVGFLRRGLHRFYACDRGFPLTLAAFNERVLDVNAMDLGETVDSRVKNLPRRLRRDGGAGVFVAETLLVDTDEDGTERVRVRETEILLTDRRRDGAIEFLEYDEAGDLRSASRFAAASGAESVGAVPFTCIACHGTLNVTP